MSAMRVSSRESDGRSMTLTGKPTAPITFGERFFERKAGKDRARRPSPLHFLSKSLLFSCSFLTLYAPIVVSSFEKRFACDFSARASVSNQSATSAKPSSRAVFAKPGYICVYSRSEERRVGKEGRSRW